MNSSGRQTLDNLIEELHELIQKHRASKPLRLFTEPQETPLEISIDHKPWLKTAGLVCAVLLGSYMISQTLLEHRAQQIIDQQLQSNTLSF